MREPRKAVAAPSSAARAHAEILAAIIDGTHPPGTMLSENDLALRIGVSRTPIRAALARLQDDGWVTIYPKRGALVRAPSPEEIADLADARLVLESSGVSRATTAGRARLAEELHDAVERQRAALTAADVAAFVELTLSFHAAFVAAGGNRYLIDLCDRFADRQRQLLFAQREVLLSRSEAILEEHERLLERLREDDPAGFAEVLRAHLARTHGDHLAPL